MDALPRILLVDDEPFNLDYLVQELEDQKLEILTAQNGQEALDEVARQPPDLIFLDIMMPELDGFEVLARLKADPRWNTIPVVVVSASNDLPNIARSIELGAEDFLPKPFDPVLLHARLNAGLEKKRLRDIEQRYLRSLERELEIGREIQTSFLPKEIPQPGGWHISAFFRPAREVAGDFYDVFKVSEKHLVVLIGDVTDKGVGSALFMALFRSLLRAVIMLDTLTADFSSVTIAEPTDRLLQAVTLVNRYICEIHDSRMFATLFVGILDVQSGQLRYINAGHDLPYLLRRDSKFTNLSSTGPLVGAFIYASFTTQIVQIEPGEILVLYSDGITDAHNPAGEMYTQDRWERMLIQPVPSSQNQIEHLTNQVLEFIGEAPQFDDITLVSIRRLDE